MLPSLWQARTDGRTRQAASDIYYPEIKRAFRKWEDYFEGQVQTWLDSFDLSTLTPAQRQQLEQLLQQQFPEESAAALHRRAG